MAFLTFMQSNKYYALLINAHIQMFSKIGNYNSIDKVGFRKVAILVIKIQNFVDFSDLDQLSTRKLEINNN